MSSKVIILYGPPGSGKGTQANLLADKLGLIHFDTGKILESVVHDPARQSSAVVRRERKLFDGGKLMTPSFVLNEVRRETMRLAKAGWGVVFSGSPRTMFEAKGLMPLLEKYHGKKNIFVFLLRVSDATSIKRNSSRMMCKFCGYGLLTAYYPSRHPKYCPVCGGSFYRRTLDNPKTIRVRLVEYEKRTKPIFEFLKNRGYRLHAVDARPAPYKIFQRIFKMVKGVGSR